MIDIVIAIGLIGNVFICILMVWRGWIARLPWFFLTTLSAVLVEAGMYALNQTQHTLYDSARIFLEYWLYTALFVRCGWEAHQVGIVWLERLMLIQTSLALVALFAHLGGYDSRVYRVELFNCYFNVAGIVYSVWRFRKEADYARPQRP